MNLPFTIAPIETEAHISMAQKIFNEARVATQGLPSKQLSMSEFYVLIEGEWMLGAWRQRKEAELMGFISIWKPDNFVHHLFIAPSHHGKGLGSALIQEVHRQLGLPLHLKCGAENTKAQQFYEKSGWQRGTTGVGVDGSYYNYSLLT